MMHQGRSSWADADQVAKALSHLKSPSDYISKTLITDASQPPTPDDTGRPTNFQTIAPGLYRSSYPHFLHFDSLADLSLKTVVTLVPEHLPFAYGNFISTQGIVHYHIPILANKDAKVFTPVEVVHQVMELMLDPSNYPMMIHCNKGKHRTGCMTACFRKVCGWTDEAAIEEYIQHSTPKERELDMDFIRRFDASVLKPIALERGYIGGVYKPPMGETNQSERSNASVYTNNSVATYGTDETTGEARHEYQEKIRQENNDWMESARRWDHR